MSDTRRHPSLSVLRSDVTPDSTTPPPSGTAPDTALDNEDAPTGVIDRITGDWALPEEEGPYSGKHAPPTASPTSEPSEPGFDYFSTKHTPARQRDTPERATSERAMSERAMSGGEWKSWRPRPYAPSHPADEEHRLGGPDEMGRHPGMDHPARTDARSGIDDVPQADEPTRIDGPIAFDQPQPRKQAKQAERAVPPPARGQSPRQHSPSLAQPFHVSAPGWGRPDPELMEEAEAERRPKPPREPYLDNVKFVLIALVVTGHSLVPTLAADSARATYLFIYVFHMPLFVIISGYLSRNFWNSNAKTNKLVDTFLVPYVIVEVGYAAVRFALGQKWSITIIDPAWLNWYLLALLFWRLSTPVWKRMRYPLVIAVAVYLFSGLSDLPGDFSMDRFFGLMPFFVLGLVIKPSLFDFLKRRWVQVLSVLVLIGAAGVAVYLVKNYSIKLGPIYYKNSYNDLNLVWWKGMIMRAGLLGAALAMSAAVMSLIPRGETWFSDLGTRTLYCYLLHGVLVLVAKKMGWLDVPWLYGPLGVATIVTSCFAVAIILCLPVTRTVFKWLLEPRLTWLYRKPSDASQSAQKQATQNQATQDPATGRRTTEAERPAERSAARS